MKREREGGRRKGEERKEREVGGGHQGLRGSTLLQERRIERERERGAKGREMDKGEATEAPKWLKSIPRHL